jgi:hypothetical protein
MQYMQQLFPFVVSLQMVSQQWQEPMRVMPTALEWNKDSEESLRKSQKL